MKFIIMYLICGMLWGLWEVHYMEHVSGQFYKIAKMKGLSDDEYEKSRKSVKLFVVISIGVVWPLAILIDIPKIYIFDKI